LYKMRWKESWGTGPGEWNSIQCRSAHTNKIIYYISYIYTMYRLRDHLELYIYNYIYIP
jgi:hypothetical protein